MPSSTTRNPSPPAIHTPASSAGNQHRFGRIFAVLPVGQLDHRRVHVQERNEIQNHRRIHQNLIRACGGFANLAEQQYDA